MIVACALLPDSSNRVTKQLISEPYQDWKDLLQDIKNNLYGTIKRIHENNEQP